jgi:hypothetical protein
VVDQAGERVVVLVPVVHHDGAVQVGEHERGEGGHAAVAEEVTGQQPGAGDQQVALAGLRPRADPDRGLVRADHVREDDQAPDQLVRLRDRRGGPGDHRVHEPRRGPRTGQRLDQLRAAVHRHRVRNYQEHAPGPEIHPVGDRARGASARRRDRPVHPPAPARHLVHVMLDHLRRGQRDVHHLVRGRHAQIPRVRQGGTTLTGPLREVIHPLVRVLAPGQVRPRRPRLLARLALPTAGASPPAACGQAGHRPAAASRSSPSCGRSAAPGGPPAAPARRSPPQAARSRRPARPAGSIAPPVTTAHTRPRPKITTS